MFWSNSEPERARAALNTALWRLRRLLATVPESDGGANLVTLGDDVALERSTWLNIDSTEFDEKVTEALRHGPNQPKEAAAKGLATAVALYSGPFFDGENEDWVLIERERLHSLYVRAAQELARQHMRYGQLDNAIQILRDVLAADPFREAIHRDLLMLLLLNEQRGDALRTHEKWSALIGRELGIRPMPQTEALIAAIRGNQTRAWLNTAVEAYINGRGPRSEDRHA